jgi:hypothetical protein
MILPVRQIHLPLEEEGAFFAGPLGKTNFLPSLCPFFLITCMTAAYLL